MLVRAVVVMAVFLSSVAYADNFDVQIGAFRNPDVARITLPANVGELRSTTGSDGLTRFSVGPFLSRADATSARDRLRESGFPGAFIRASQGGESVVTTRAFEPAPAVSSSTYDASDDVAEGEGVVVMLDGKLHRKVGDRFILIRE